MSRAPVNCWVLIWRAEPEGIGMFTAGHHLTVRQEGAQRIMAVPAPGGVFMVAPQMGFNGPAPENVHLILNIGWRVAIDQPAQRAPHQLGAATIYPSRKPGDSALTG